MDYLYPLRTLEMRLGNIKYFIFSVGGGIDGDYWAVVYSTTTGPISITFLIH